MSTQSNIKYKIETLKRKAERAGLKDQAIAACNDVIMELENPRMDEVLFQRLIKRAKLAIINAENPDYVVEVRPRNGGSKYGS